MVFIDGTLFNAGGKVSTNIHVETEDEEFTIDCMREQASIVRVYNKVYVAVVKKWKVGVKPHYKCLDNYLTKEKFSHYQSFYNKILNDKSLAKYDTIHNEIVRIIKDGNLSNGEALKIMRLYNYETADRGIIRTILITLKPVLNDNKDLSDMYQSLAKILREGSIHKTI